jgi:DNA-binding MarR family transcriptional regulator
MQDAHNGYDITDFHGALLDIISVMNQPVRDEQILQAAGVKLEQMLFPLLVAVGRYGPVGVVELADHLGRDYTTVSRQVKKLEAQGLAGKQPNRHDRRISEVTLSARGQQMIDSIAVARRRLMNQVLAQWPEDEVQALFRLTRKYADSLQKYRRLARCQAADGQAVLVAAFRLWTKAFSSSSMVCGSSR